MFILKRSIRLLLVLVVCCSWVAAPAHAKSHRENRSTNGGYRVAGMDGSAAARLVEQRTGGRVLGVQRQEKKGKVVYRVKVLLPEGRVRTVTVDAETGQMGG